MTEKELETMKTRNRKYDGFGEQHSGAKWARLLNLPRNSLWRYLKKGLTIEEIAQVRNIKYK